ncbi:MAG: hypothetical protein OXN89_18385 [Bryobacterales bacterium]|nr:hypothetical protein [Bryobacterales bacterium]
MAGKLAAGGGIGTTVAERFRAHYEGVRQRAIEERQSSARRQRELLCLLVRQQFGPAIEAQASGLLADAGDTDRLREIQAWVFHRARFRGGVLRQHTSPPRKRMPITGLRCQKRAGTSEAPPRL